jgi:hypothetical protein
MVSTIKGLLIGIGLGLQICDILDLSAIDYTPRYGWRNGLVFLGLLGTALGCARNYVLACRWLILLGFMNLSLGSTVAFITFAESPINLYTGIIIAAGFCYVLLGAIIGIVNHEVTSSSVRNGSPKTTATELCDAREALDQPF